MNHGLQILVPLGVSALNVNTSSLPSDTENVAYSANLQASGGVPAYTWSLLSGSLPTGLSLAASTGVISGTPSVAGTSSFTVQVEDSASNTAFKALSITINSESDPEITTSSLPDGTVGDAYSETLAATEGQTPYSWTATGLPSTLTCSTGGVISGTPTAADTYTVDIKVTDANSNTDSVDLGLKINSAPSGSNPLLGFFLTSESPSSEASACPVSMQIASYYAGGSAWNSFTAPSSISPATWIMVSVGQLTSAQVTSIGNSLVSAGYTNALIRPMWEFNDNSFPWKSLTASEYVSAFQGIYTEFKAISEDFTICWCPNNTTSIPTTFYPGNSYCDSVGEDIYDYSGYGNSLNAIINFGGEQGKPIHLGEWGLNGTDDTTFINTMADGILNASNNFLFHVYFSADLTINSLLSDFPNSQAAFKSDFGG